MSGGKRSLGIPPIHQVPHLSTEFRTYPPSFPPIHRVSHLATTFHLSTEFLAYPPSFPPTHRVCHLSTEFPRQSCSHFYLSTRFRANPRQPGSHLHPSTKLGPFLRRPSSHLHLSTKFGPSSLQPGPHFHPSTKFGPTLPSLPSNSRPSNQARPMILPPRPPHKMCLHVQTKIACRRGRRECYKFPYSGGYSCRFIAEAGVMGGFNSPPSGNVQPLSQP